MLRLTRLAFGASFAVPQGVASYGGSCFPTNASLFPARRLSNTQPICSYSSLDFKNGRKSDSNEHKKTKHHLSAHTLKAAELTNTPYQGPILLQGSVAIAAAAIEKVAAAASVTAETLGHMLGAAAAHPIGSGISIALAGVLAATTTEFTKVERLSRAWLQSMKKKSVALNNEDLDAMRFPKLIRKDLDDFKELMLTMGGTIQVIEGYSASGKTFTACNILEELRRKGAPVVYLSTRCSSLVGPHQTLVNACGALRFNNFLAKIGLGTSSLDPVFVQHIFEAAARLQKSRDGPPIYVLWDDIQTFIDPETKTLTPASASLLAKFMELHFRQEIHLILMTSEQGVMRAIREISGAKTRFAPAFVQRLPDKELVEWLTTPREGDGKIFFDREIAERMVTSAAGSLLELTSLIPKIFAAPEHLREKIITGQRRRATAAGVHSFHLLAARHGARTARRFWALLDELKQSKTGSVNLSKDPEVTHVLVNANILRENQSRVVWHSGLTPTVYDEYRSIKGQI